MGVQDWYARVKNSLCTLRSLTSKGCYRRLLKIGRYTQHTHVLLDSAHTWHVVTNSPMSIHFSILRPYLKVDEEELILSHFVTVPTSSLGIPHSRPEICKLAIRALIYAS
jgi:hypothetical protein